MAIVDQLTASTRESIIPGKQNQIMAAGAFVNVLLRFSRFTNGAAGNGIRINAVIDRNKGQWYSGFDDAVRQQVEKLRSYFALWYNHETFAVLSGTEVEENLGVDTEWFLDPSRSLENEPPDRIETAVNLAGNEIDGAIDSWLLSYEYATHNGAASGDDATRVVESLSDLFDETGSWHGVAPAGLGLWSDHAKHPWTSTRPGDNTTANIHEPRFFDGGGSNRAISVDILRTANLQMGAIIPGFWICGLDAQLFATLLGEVESLVQIPMGAGTVTFMEDAFRIGRAFYFADAFAPTDKARHVHVGVPGMERSGTFYPMWWTGPRRSGGLASRVSGVRGAMPGVAPAPTPSPRVINLGRAVNVPLYSERWDRDQRRADSVSAAVKGKVSNVCTHRWAQYEVRELTTA